MNIATAKPGQEVRVLVRAEVLEAVGTLSRDGNSFSVVVTKEGGAQETLDLSCGDLLKVIAALE